MLLTYATIAIALFFAANIGASGTAAAMGAAYGGGAVRSRLLAVLLVALFAVLGANWGGQKVTMTIGKGIVPQEIATVQVTAIILVSSCATLYIANRIGIPLSTSEVAVGSLVGAGLAFSQVYWGKLLWIVLSWIALPVLAFAVAYWLGKAIRPAERWLDRQRSGRIVPLLKLLLVAMGCYEAFSAGMNNVANAIGPLVGAGVIELDAGLLIGSLCMAVGAILMGGKVLETNGKKITELSLLQGSAVSFTGGTLVIAASLLGMPVPLTQATTMAIIGVGSERAGRDALRKPVVRRIFKIWIISPIASLILCFTLIQIMIFHALPFIVLLSGALACSFPFLYMKFRTARRPLSSEKD